MPLQRFIGKVALCTGATQGIGLAAARRLAQEGCKVVVNSRKQDNVDEAVDGLRKEGFEVSGTTGNTRIKEDRSKIIRYACEKYGGIDCVFMSAGVSPHYGDFSTAFDTNVKANFQFIQELTPFLEKRGKGSIVTNATVSVYGALAAIAAKNIPLYVVSKTCLVALTHHVSQELMNKKIRINCVAPGPVPTKFMDGGTDQAAFDEYWQVAGLKPGDEAVRAGTPDEIAGVVAFLLSDDSSFVTGNCIIASGGYVLHRSI